MADLNKSLKDYLSRSQKNGSGDVSETKTSYFSAWMGKGDSADDPTASEVANGWFSEAQKDPCLPSLVSH
jgi:hypothetical protein